MKLKTSRYKNNVDEILPPEQEDELIQNLLSILEQLNWTLSYKITPNTDKIEGIIVGTDNFVNEVLTAIDGENSIDINEMFTGKIEDLN